MIAPIPTLPIMIVEALFQCNPDREDELGFNEGDRIVVTAKLNSDWWVSSNTYTYSIPI